MLSPVGSDFAVPSVALASEERSLLDPCRASLSRCRLSSLAQGEREQLKTSW